MIYKLHLNKAVTPQALDFKIEEKINSLNKLK